MSWMPVSSLSTSSSLLPSGISLNHSISFSSSVPLAFSLLSVVLKPNSLYILQGQTPYISTGSPEPGTSISSLCQSPNSLLYPSASARATPDHLHAPGTPPLLSDSSTHVISTNWNLASIFLWIASILPDQVQCHFSRSSLIWSS